MKIIGRILIILGVAWLIVMGMNWLRTENVLPTDQFATTEGFRERERPRGGIREGIFSAEGRPPFGERDGHPGETPSLAGATEMVGTLAKLGIITMIVVAIDLILKFFNRRRPKPAT
ncbi:hypothetical protein [Chloroflexus sp.]|uniref:hypothetical protein n=1 Tax=Chloroflexus sp. TaxID=1904827 RepID=UPI00261296D7|nr:hypothetical protein [uncultured Chloroflexus sp.]